MRPAWRRPLDSDMPRDHEWRRDTLLRGRASSASSQTNRAAAAARDDESRFPPRPPSPRSWFRPKALYLTMLNAFKRVVSFMFPATDFIQNPQCVSDRTLPKHAPLHLFASKNEALASGILQCEPAAKSKRTLVLNSDAGHAEWRFALFASPSKAEAAERSVDVISFETFGVPETVPSQWQLTGNALVDAPLYSNITFPIPHRATNLSTHVSLTDNPTGLYIARFSVPEAWTTSCPDDIVLIVHGAASCVKVYCDGAYVGYSEDSMTESEFDLTPYLKSPTGGVHLLALVVAKFCSGSYLEDQDMWRLCGVHRSVELQLRRRSCLLWDYELNASLAAGTVAATFDFYVAADAEADEQFLARMSLLDPITLDVVETAMARVIALPPTTPPRSPALSAYALEVDKPRGRVRGVATTVLYARQALSDSGGDVRAWTAETPVLYPLLIEVLAATKGDDAAAKPVLQVELVRVGFRDVTITHGQLVVNNVPVTIRGVNRHEFDAHRGKVLGEASMIADVLQMKRHNVNAVRSCHYPQVARWYELCDHYGLYVCDEANIETHGFTLGLAISLLQFDAVYLDAFLSRVWSMVMRSRNHACVIAWSLGNESGFGPNMEQCARLLRRVDKHRPVAYEGGIKSGDAPLVMGDGQDAVSDFVCPMYHTPLQIESYARDAAEPRPIVLCEYGHNMGLSGGGLHLYWSLFNSQDPDLAQCQGGYLWDWVDQGLVVPRTALAQPPTEAPLLMDREAFLRAWLAPVEPDAARFMNGRYCYGGDCGGAAAHDAQFCCNGLVFPDRTAKPCLLEAKYLMSPLRFELVDVRGDGRVVVAVHRRRGAAPWALEFTYELFGDTAARAMCTGLFDPAGSDGGVVQLPEQGEPGRWFLRVCGRLAEPLSWAAAGHEVGWESWELARTPVTGTLARVVASPIALLPSPATAVAAAAAVATEGGEAVVVAARYTARVSLETGALLSLRGASDGEERLVGAVQFCFRRACTDNDLGGADKHVPAAAASLLLPAKAWSNAGLWRALGLHEDLSVEVVDSSVAEEARVTVSCVHRNAKGVALFATRLSYIFTDAAVVIRAAVKPSRALRALRTLARVGLTMQVPASCSHVAYMARGPFESYPDRKAGAALGVYECAVDDMHVPYIYPSENGGRADATWLTVRDDVSGSGLLIEYFCDDAPAPDDAALMSGGGGGGVEPANAVAGLRPMGTKGAQLSLSRFTLSALDRAAHQWELGTFDALKDMPVEVHVDTAHCGIGGDVSWLPSVHAQYLVSPACGPWTFRVDLSVLAQGDQARPVKQEQFQGHKPTPPGVLAADEADELVWLKRA